MFVIVKPALHKMRQNSWPQEGSRAFYASAHFSDQQSKAFVSPSYLGIAHLVLLSLLFICHCGLRKTVLPHAKQPDAFTTFPSTELIISVFTLFC